MRTYFPMLIGNEETVRRLGDAVRGGILPHAHLIVGPSGSGKHTLALGIAAALNCENADREDLPLPCGICNTCRRIREGNFTDLRRLSHADGRATIGVDEVRAFREDMFLSATESAHKIYIIEEFDTATPQAQNALLKTIEEPPAYAVILLLANNADRLLPTILSRCVRLNLKAVRDQDIREYLMDKMKIPDYQADVSLKFAQGNVGKAVQLASSETFAAMKDEALSLLHETDRMELYELMDAVKKISDYKNDIDSFLDIVTIWLRDVLMFKATQDANSLIFREDLSAITARARKSSYEGLEEMIQAVDRARARLKANVNFDLVLELLLLTIKEN